MRSARSAGALAAVLLLVAACGGGDDGPPSFSRDVAPILRDKCAGCHQAGGIAPFSLESAQTARARAPAIAAMVESRRMPPWPPGSSSPAYEGEEKRTLSADESETVVRWARSGAAVDGPALEARPAAQVQPAKEETVVDLTMPRAYTPAGETDDYRCFLLDTGLTRYGGTSVTSAVIRPGAPRLVHHVILFRAEPGQVEGARRLDAEHDGQGWPCFGGTGLDVGPSSLKDAGWISAWAPGGEPVRYPAGTGAWLPPGSAIVMQVHYNLANGRAPDRTTAVLTVSPRDLTPAATMLLPAPIELACAEDERGMLCDRDAALADLVRRHGGGAAFVPTALLALCGRLPVADAVSSCERGFDERTTIHGVAGHMHLLGRSIRVELNPGTDEARVLLDIPRWDFHWQSAYMLEEAVVAEPGDRVRVTCRHDVSLRRSEPRYILWGEGTSDEMCLGVLQVTRG